MRVASLVEQAQAAHDRRSALYQSYEDAVNKFKATKDLTNFTVNRKKIDADHKALTSQIATLLTKLKAEGSEAADKVWLSLINLFLVEVHTHVFFPSCNFSVRILIPRFGVIFFLRLKRWYSNVIEICLVESL